MSGRHEEALRLADAVPTIPLYGAPEPNDGMLEPLVGEPGYEALLNRSRDHVDAERARLGLPKMKR